MIHGRPVMMDQIRRILITHTEHASAQIIPILHAADRNSSLVIIPGPSDAWRVAYSGKDVTDDYIKGPPGYTKTIEQPQEPVVAASGVEVGLPRFFIVHGHDSALKWEIKNYLQNVLHLPEPIILHEKASHGRTIIETFEEHAGEATGAVVLLTPDDKWIEEGTDEELRRARQNVVFELGFFFGAFGRRSGRVILLHDGKLDLPSDIAGVVYIDISNGIGAAGEKIRKEILES